MFCGDGTWLEADMLNALKKLFRWVYRSAVTGKFVSEEYAKEHPDTTTKERV